MYAVDICSGRSVRMCGRECVYTSEFMYCVSEITTSTHIRACFIAGVTILLSLTVFLNMVAETMPATSDAVPLLGKVFSPKFQTNILKTFFLSTGLWI